MNTKKEQFIFEWQSYISTIDVVGNTGTEEQAWQIHRHVKELMKLVALVAENIKEEQKVEA